ncbi:MAG: capsular polysaccharide synthesis protein [Bacteroidaceae bacterium]|nr:capsular polysaccharide synthesis protein [Bacteroidaceae bacterium]
MNKASIKTIIPAGLWRLAREKKILRSHRRVATICEKLIASYFEVPEYVESVKAKVSFPEGTKIIWQYWAQGFNDLPEVVNECLASVDKYAGEWRVIRLTDNTISDYLNIPEYVLKKKPLYGYTSFSDLLRLMLLSTYGGIWIDATVLLTGQIPQDYLSKEFFAFQRDPEESNKDYWKNTYAYYFSWSKGFHVRFLSSFMIADSHSEIISTLCGCMLKWWKENDNLPDYFFFQILFDVLIEGKLKPLNCPIVSDCPPHYLQQFRNDSNFYIKSEEEIFALSTIHKLTYK